MSTVDFEKADEVRQLANVIIDKYHPHLVDAKSVIGYYFRDGVSDWAGKAKKCTAFERHVTGYLLFVFINQQAWTMLLPEQREALVDHELCHFSRAYSLRMNPKTLQEEKEWTDAKDPENWSIREHDVEEFSEIIRRHGLWETGIEHFAEAIREVDYQMTIGDVHPNVVNFRSRTAE